MYWVNFRLYFLLHASLSPMNSLPDACCSPCGCVHLLSSTWRGRSAANSIGRLRIMQTLYPKAPLRGGIQPAKKPKP